MKKNKIDFIGVGSAKSGTSWIAKCLNEHPEIFIPKQKELHFLYQDKNLYNKNIPKNYNKNDNWYFNHFKHAKNYQIKGEFSVFYIDDKDNDKIIKQKIGNTKIIIILRDPIKRLISYYLRLNPLNTINKNFSEFIRKEKDIVGSGHYYKKILKYIKSFGKEKVFIGIIENINENPKKFFSEIFEFLEVDKNFIPKSIGKKINKTNTISNIKKQKIFLYFSNLRKKLIKNKYFNLIINTMIFIKINKIFEKYLFDKTIYDKTITKDDYIYLKNIYEKDTLLLSELLNIDLDKYWIKDNKFKS